MHYSILFQLSENAEIRFCHEFENARIGKSVVAGTAVGILYCAREPLHLGAYKLVVRDDFVKINHSFQVGLHSGLLFGHEGRSISARQRIAKALGDFFAGLFQTHDLPLAVAALFDKTPIRTFLLDCFDDVSNNFGFAAFFGSAGVFFGTFLDDRLKINVSGMGLRSLALATDDIERTGFKALFQFFVLGFEIRLQGAIRRRGRRSINERRSVLAHCLVVVGNHRSCREG